MQLAEAKRGRPLGATGYRTRKVGGDYRGGTIGASPAYSTTAHIAEVTVDEETGIVTVEKVWVAHDCGFALNPTLVEGQIEGSVYMGYAEAIMEAQLYDERGLHLGPNLLDYAIPTSVETPDILAEIVEAHDPGGPYGAKEAGEGPLHPSFPPSRTPSTTRSASGSSAFFTPERVLAAPAEQRGTRSNHAGGRLRLPRGGLPEDAVSLYDRLDKPMYVAGGTTFCPTRHRIIRPENPIGLAGVLDTGVTQTDTEDHRRRYAPVRPGPAHGHPLAEAAGLVAGPQIRNMGTIGGNVLLDTRCLFYNQTEFWRKSLGYRLKAEGDWCQVIGGPRPCGGRSSNTVPVLPRWMPPSPCWDQTSAYQAA